MATFTIPFADTVSVDGDVFSLTNDLKTSTSKKTDCVLVGMSDNRHGVRGRNGGGSGELPQHGAGVWGESDFGFGVYASSKSAASIKAVNTSGELAGEFTGKVSVSGDITAAANVIISGSGDLIVQGADCAEQFDTKGAEAAEPGTVLIISPDGALEQSKKSYDRRVAGVVSGAGNFKSGILLDRRPDRGDRTPVALVGKVYCKVDASSAPIEIGDLLTTSDTPGHAMKASDTVRAFGAVIGKALQPLASGRGLLPMLIALQ